MGELGAEAQVGVQEVEQEVEGALLDKVGDEPEHTIISLSLMVDDILREPVIYVLAEFVR